MTVSRAAIDMRHSDVECRISIAAYDDLKLVARYLGRRTHADIIDIVVSAYGNALYSNIDVGGFEIGVGAVGEQRKKVCLLGKTVEVLKRKVIPKMVRRSCGLPDLDISAALNIILPTFVDVLFPVFMHKKLEETRRVFLEDIAGRARQRRLEREKT